MDYYRRKTEFIPAILAAFGRLEQRHDIIVLEGAGSPAEINLRENDIVNMGMARMVQAPVLLVGDIDRGGVFASLYGTVALLEPEERAMIKGFVINKFRGDKKLLEPGLKMIEERLGIPVLGVIPMGNVDLDDEDSLSQRLICKDNRDEKAEDMLDIVVIRLPHISNFTDFHVLEQKKGVAMRYVDKPGQLGSPDLTVLPGTKNTIEDLRWLRESGLERELMGLTERNVPLIGICGGYQMLGQWLSDPEGVECPPGTTIEGMGLLPAETVFSSGKIRTRITGKLRTESKMFAGYEGEEISGYEIHMGETVFREKGQREEAVTAIILADGRTDGMERADGMVFGTYLHGLFDNERLTACLLRRLAARKGIGWPDGQKEEESWSVYKERQYDRLADLVRNSLDMERIYSILA